VQLGHTETARSKAEVEITALRVRLTDARAQAQHAAQAAAELREADAARRGLGVLARVRAAAHEACQKVSEIGLRTKRLRGFTDRLI